MIAQDNRPVELRLAFQQLTDCQRIVVVSGILDRIHGALPIRIRRRERAVTVIKEQIVDVRRMPIPDREINRRKVVERVDSIQFAAALNEERHRVGRIGPEGAIRRRIAQFAERIGIESPSQQRLHQPRLIRNRREVKPRSLGRRSECRIEIYLAGIQQHFGNVRTPVTQRISERIEPVVVDVIRVRAIRE